MFRKGVVYQCLMGGKHGVWAFVEGQMSSAESKRSRVEDEKSRVASRTYKSDNTDAKFVFYEFLILNCK